jgi:hypothetical protein
MLEDTVMWRMKQYKIKDKKGVKMKYLFKIISLSGAIISVVLLSGCASTSGPKSRVAIVNGKYTIQTTVPNNNKGKKVNLTAGQNYSCKKSYLDNDGKQHRVTFDLKFSDNGKNITWYNDKVDGITPEGYYIGKIAFKPGLGYVETTKGKQAFILTKNNSGKIAVFGSVKDREKFIKLTQRFQNGEITQSEYANIGSKQKIRIYDATCTQTTNNTVTHTRYLTDHEIDAYKYRQRLKEARDRAEMNEVFDAMGQLGTQLQQMNGGMVNSYQNYSLKSSSSGCSSDFDCGLGQSCVKPQYSRRGSCMKSVNSSGIQQFNPHQNNVGPNTSKQCTFNTDCPIGFRCSGGNCVK